MKSTWRGSLALILAAVYLAVVSFGHCFHNHGLGQHGNCHCACHASHHDHHSSDNATDHDTPASDGLWSASSNCVPDADGDCPVCHFYSHHSLPVHVVAATTAVDVIEQVVLASRPSMTWACHCARQPRAPPFLI